MLKPSLGFILALVTRSPWTGTYLAMDGQINELADEFQEVTLLGARRYHFDSCGSSERDRRFGRVSVLVEIVSTGALLLLSHGS